LTLHAIATPHPERYRSMTLFLRRLLALLQRHVYLLTGSWPRLIEMLYWPTINMMVWGFTSLYVLRVLNHAIAVSGIFVAGVILTEVFFRSTVGMMLMFLEEVWSRNLGHLFASPLKFSDYLIGIMGLSLLRTMISISLAVVVANYLFDFSLFSLGRPLLGFLALLLLSGWWYGFLMIALLLRFGLAAEWTAWMLVWLIIPIIAPYYPVSVLPQWMQFVSWALPQTYVFECVKDLIGQHQLRTDYLIKALALNVVYFVACAFIFYRAYQGARRRGGLLQMGE